MSDRGKQLAAAELRVVASVLDPGTTSQATATANAANVCAEMFTDDNLRELFTSYSRGLRVEYKTADGLLNCRWPTFLWT